MYFKFYSIFPGKLDNNKKVTSERIGDCIILELYLMLEVFALAPEL